MPWVAGGISSLHGLRALTVEFDCESDAGSTALLGTLKRMPLLSAQLSLRGVKVFDRSATVLAEGLLQATRLQALTLSVSAPSHSRWEQLMPALRGLTRLTELQVYCFGLDGEGADVLAMCVEPLAHLSKLVIKNHGAHVVERTDRLWTIVQTLQEARWIKIPGMLGTSSAARDALSSRLSSAPWANRFWPIFR